MKRKKIIASINLVKADLKSKGVGTEKTDYKNKTDFQLENLLEGLCSIRNGITHSK